MAEEAAAKKGISIETSALRAYTMLGALALIWIFFHWRTGGNFVTPENLSNLMTQTSVTGIIAIGMLMVIVAGQIDLSVGSLLGLAGAVSAIVLTNYGHGLAAAIIAAIVVGIVVGLLQGSLVAYFNIPAFIVTLGGLLAWRGVVKGITNSSTVPVADLAFIDIGQSYLHPTVGWVLALAGIAAVFFMAYRKARVQKEYGLGEGAVGPELARAVVPAAAIVIFIYVMNSYAGIPNPVLIFLIVALVGYFLTNNTTFGRYLYAIGGNAEAARLSGINNRLIILKVFALLGAFVGLAAIVNTARLGSATVDAGALKELDAIAACVIGGTSLMGGRGTVFGACLGALIMASLDNGMSSINLENYLQDVIKGVILVTAVGLDMIGKRP
jgi:D-xylose transport system permease protein